MAGPASRSLLRDLLLLFLGVLAATWLVGPIEADTTLTLLLVALVLTLLNLIVKPVLVIFTLPFVIFTLGLGILLINGILLYLAGQLVPGFTVPGFGAAFLGALVISLINLVAHLVFAPRVRVRVRHGSGRRPPRDYIDI